MPATPPLAHIAVTVSDLDRSVAFYTELFGAPPLIVSKADRFRWAAWATFGVHQHDEPVTDVAFDERRVGLDHVAFPCADRAELEGWGARLDALGVARGDILDEPYGSGLAFRDPDGIALEFFAPPPRR
jgi:catechol 2,3-dioxygenase-like lactoylglutathione lyase family enzyme